MGALFQGDRPSYELAWFVTLEHPLGGLRFPLMLAIVNYTLLECVFLELLQPLYWLPIVDQNFMEEKIELLYYSQE